MPIYRNSTYLPPRIIYLINCFLKKWFLLESMHNISYHKMNTFIHIQLHSFMYGVFWSSISTTCNIGTWGPFQYKDCFLKYGDSHYKVLYYLYTVETLYSTIYYSKYFIELNFDKSTYYVALWTHKRHPIPRPFGRAMECLLWVL